MSKPNVKRVALLGLLLFSVFLPLKGEMSWDSERLNLEIRMQARVEEALSKILPPGEFVVVIRIDPWPASVDKPQEVEMPQDDFFLPGVPVKKNLAAETNNQVKTLVDTMIADRMFKRFIRRIIVTLVLDQALPEEEVVKVRELTRQLIGLDVGRGDTLTIQRTTFNKVQKQIEATGMSKIQKGLRSYWLLIALALVLLFLLVFFLFMFGPLRGFLNNLVQILPTLKPPEPDRAHLGRDIQNLPMYQQFGLPGPSFGGGGPASFSGSLQVENPNKTVLPFGFVREDHLSNLAILLSRESPEKAAVVLGYLPPEWISRVLAKLDSSMQSEIASHLATTRQLLPEQVEDIEADLKRRLDYLVGGPDRLFAIYDSLDIESQKRMLEGLKETRPEIAEEIRQRSMAFEDLEKFDAAGLKALLREADLKTIVLSLKGMSESFKQRIFEHVTEGKAQIIREELELSDGIAGKATMEARKKMVSIAKRLEREGQINIPQVAEIVPTTRFGSSLRSTLKLPPELKLENPSSGPVDKEDKTDIKERIRRFMNREKTEDEPRERYSLDDDRRPEPPRSTGTGE